MKDPALLFYFNDWMGGTATMSRHLKGCYMDLLCVQFNSGALSLEEIKTVLGSDFGSSWPTLQKKFSCENGLYFNERLQNEKNKRVKFTESRRKNAQHMPKHMEDRNINRNELPNWLNLKAWEAWKQYRSERKKTLTPTSERLQLKFLEANQQDHAQIIKNSITNGWTGLFPIKEKENRSKASYERYSKNEDESERKRTAVENEVRNKLLKQSEDLIKN